MPCLSRVRRQFLAQGGARRRKVRSVQQRWGGVPVHGIGDSGKVAGIGGEIMSGNATCDSVYRATPLPPSARDDGLRYPRVRLF